MLDRGKKIADIVVEFWQVVQSQMPEPFETPEDYFLHGAMGVLCMHTVLTSLLGDMHQGRRRWVADEFVTMISTSEWFTDAGQGGPNCRTGGVDGLDWFFLRPDGDSHDKDVREALLVLLY